MQIVHKLLAIIIVLLTNTTAYASQLVINSNDFLDNGVLPVLYTCDSKGISPQLSWDQPQKNVRSLAVILSNADKQNTPKFHWILYNLPANTTELSENMTKLPNGAKTIPNSWNKANYTAPCPDRGSVQSYIFTVYALDNTIQLPPNAKVDDLYSGMKGHILQSGTFTAVYSRWPAPLHE